MESRQILHLEFDLDDGEVRRRDAGSSIRATNKGVNSWRKFQYDEFHGWTTGSIFDGDVRRALAESVDHGGRFTPFREVDGDFLCIGFEPESRRLSLVNDQNGKYRLYFCRDGSTVHASNHLWSLASEVEHLNLSGFGLYNYLSTGHVVDPWTLFEGIEVVQIGEVVTLTLEETARQNYQQVIDRTPSLYSGVEESVEALDEALSSVFEKRIRERPEPLVLLSGGIDSVTMMHYLDRVQGFAPPSLTFSMKGETPPDEAASKRAARYFESPHEVVEVDPEQSWEYFVEGLVRADTPQYASLLFRGVVAEGPEWLRDESSGRTVFSGQDTRLATPSFDKAKEIGVKRNVFKLPLTKAEKGWLKALDIAGNWPYRGGGIARGFVETARQRSSAERFVLEAYFGYAPGLEREKDFHRLGDCLGLDEVRDMEQLHRATAKFQLWWQSTDNMNEVRGSFESPTNRVDLPFFDHEFVAVANRVPFREAVEPTLTFKTDHPIPVARKRILRELLGDSLPERILWRPDRAMFPAERFLTPRFRRAANRLLTEYRDQFYDHLASDYHDFLAHHLEPVIEKLPRQRPDLRRLLCFMYLASVFAAREQPRQQRRTASFLDAYVRE